MPDFTPHQETIRRIGRIEQISADIDEELRLMRPLCEALIGAACEMDKQAIPREGRSICMDKLEWRDQFKAGINMCMGFEITWV